jgi:hypothetical protein
MGLDDFPLDVSMGRHFFHKVTSLNVGYFSMNPVYNQGFIHWELLKKQRVVFEHQFVRWVKFSEPLNILLDGKQSVGIITKSGKKCTEENTFYKQHKVILRRCFLL